MKDRMATCLRDVVRSEMKCESSVFHIPWMESCNVPSDLMYGQ